MIWKEKTRKRMMNVVEKQVVKFILNLLAATVLHNEDEVSTYGRVGNKSLYMSTASQPMPLLHLREYYFKVVYLARNPHLLVACWNWRPLPYFLPVCWETASTFNDEFGHSMDFQPTQGMRIPHMEDFLEFSVILWSWKSKKGKWRPDGVIH